MTNNRMKNLDFLGFPDYDVTDDGRVFSRYYNKFLKPFVTKRGYHSYILQKNKEKRTYTAHQLVALAFIPNPNNYCTVDHKECKSNHVSNLQWLPNHLNAKKGWKDGVHNHQKKAVNQILGGEVINTYDSIAEAGRHMEVHYSSISRACKYGHMCAGYEWIFA